MAPELCVGSVVRLPPIRRPATRWPWFFLLTDHNQMLVANNLSDIITLFDVNDAGDLHLAQEISARRPIFFASWNAGLS